MIINNNIHPEHLGTDFIRQYKELKEKRIQLKKMSKDKSLPKEERAKYKAFQEALKITLNSCYGKMKYDKYWLYDPLAALRITINCQLYLLMLIEYLGIKGFNVISANTDGIVTIVPKDRKEEYFKICKAWEDATKFDLEYTYYTKYARRDINNYLSVTTTGDIKTKGDLTYSDYNKIASDPFVLRRGFDKPIIQLALNNYLIDNIPIEETIRNHTDIYDFCTSQKTDKKFTNEYHTLKDGQLHIEKIQQSVRYYISNNGVKLYKRKYNHNESYVFPEYWGYEPKYNKLILEKGLDFAKEQFKKDYPQENSSLQEYCVGKQVTLFNDYVKKDMKEYDIDYNYYINETQKILDQIIKPQLTLF